jgi:exopolysaccharide production protein ExoZ
VGAGSRIHSIQLLRGLAALAVAVVHLWFGFAGYIESRDAAPAWSNTVSQAAVAAFFVISGCVMVLSSRPLFGTPRGTLVFWRPRAVRVLPPYWIATLIFVAVALWVDLEVDGAFVARSLLFIPGGVEAPVPFLPFLWPGWTLFYELVFYLLFGAFVSAGRRRTVGVTALMLGTMAILGLALRPGGYLAGALTQPVFLLFVAGLAMGVLLDTGRTVPKRLRVLAGAGALALLGPGAALVENEWLLSVGVPGFLLFIAVAGGPIPRRLDKPADAFGDLSYALYLLHIPFAHAWMQVFNVWLPHPGGAIGFMGTGLPLLLALSFAFYRWIERPLTRWLNARLA